MPSIFDTQMRTVADRRFTDARWLLKSGKNARANGAMYLGGFVIECLLKAKLLEAHPSLQSASSPERMPGGERKLWALCYRAHHLEGLLDALPHVVRGIREIDRRQRGNRVRMLRSVCGSWTVFARYSPRQTTIREAERFLAHVRELRRWLT